MVFDELLGVMPVPLAPVDSGIGRDWGSITDMFYEPLPTDYMQFIDAYGSGTINSFLTVFNPFCANRHVNLMEQVLTILSGLRAIKARFPDEITYPLCFEPEGILPWGISIDGDIYCWWTKGMSGGWETVVICRHARAEHFNVTMTQFLARVIKGEIKSHAFPNYLAETGRAVFAPHLGVG